mgnify:FL=1
MHEKKNPNRPLIVYYIIALVVVMLLNSDQVFKCIPAFLRVNRFRWVHSLTREA